MPARAIQVAGVPWQGILESFSKSQTSNSHIPPIVLLKIIERLTGARPSARACGFRPGKEIRLLRKRRRVARDVEIPHLRVPGPPDTHRAPPMHSTISVIASP